jgi:YidC/Oxa1 family membrane protein insertase
MPVWPVRRGFCRFAAGDGAACADSAGVPPDRSTAGVVHVPVGSILRPLMPQEKNTFLRVLVPLLLIVGGIGVAWSVFNNTARQQQPRPVTPAPPTVVQPGAPGAVAPTTPPSPEPPAATTAPETQPSPEQTTPAAPATQAVVLTGLQAQSFEDDPRARNFAPIGTIDPQHQLRAQIEFTTTGAGVRSVTLAEHYKTIQRQEHIVAQHLYTDPPDPVAAGDLRAVVAPMAALSVTLNGQLVNLTGAIEMPDGSLFGRPIWRQTAPGSFEAMIVNDRGESVARIRREYELAPLSYTIRVHQGVENLSGQPLTVQWMQFGPIDLEQDVVGMAGDRRRVRFGYWLRPRQQGFDPTVVSHNFVRPRSDALGKRIKGTLLYEDHKDLWPNSESIRDELRLVWTGTNNRYFGSAIFQLFDASNPAADKVFHTAAVVDRILLQRLVYVNGDPVNDAVVALRTTSEPIATPPGATANFGMGFYAGPLSRPVINQDPLSAAAGLAGLVVYNFGGPCAICTFGWLTALLLWLLHAMHTLVADWSIAIILLVLIVRTCLHPVTRWSQIRMQRFGRQMQGLAPKQKKLQEKYGSDSQKMREEMAKLWREEGISPTGALGCIPMFLQTPVWIALYAMLFFAIELRHQPGFYGVFQALQPGTSPFWWFLGDLAEPDRFWYWNGWGFHIPLISGFLGPIQSLNLLPFVLGLVFFIQTKYLQPPAPPGGMTPEQLQQQKMMKVMMVVLFPVIMYNAPSGLALYFIANSTLGIIESRWIRKHIDKHDLLKVPPKKAPKPGGFMERLQKLAEERQKTMQNRKPPPRR